MQTRSRKLSEVVHDSSAQDTQKKAVKKIKTLAPPSKEQKAAELVVDILKSIQSENAVAEKSISEATGLPKLVSKSKILRGVPKSGRPWKDVKQRFSTIKKSIHRRTFEKKEKFRQELTHIKELSKSIKEERKLENIERKNRREDNARRRLENERKSEVIQIIKNPAKLKRMKKKALRKIEKRDSTINSKEPNAV